MGKRDGEGMRHLAEQELWGKSGDAQRGSLQSFAMCCVEWTLLSASPWLVVKSTAHRMHCNMESVSGKCWKQGDHLEWPGGWRLL